MSVTDMFVWYLALIQGRLFSNSLLKEVIITRAVAKGELHGAKPGACLGATRIFWDPGTCCGASFSPSHLTFLGVFPWAVRADPQGQG